MMMVCNDHNIIMFVYARILDYRCLEVGMGGVKRFVAVVSVVDDICGKGQPLPINNDKDNPW